MQLGPVFALHRMLALRSSLLLPAQRAARHLAAGAPPSRRLQGLPAVLRSLPYQATLEEAPPQVRCLLCSCLAMSQDGAECRWAEPRQSKPLKQVSPPEQPGNQLLEFRVSFKELIEQKKVPLPHQAALPHLAAANILSWLHVKAIIVAVPKPPTSQL